MTVDHSAVTEEVGTGSKYHMTSATAYLLHVLISFCTAVFSFHPIYFIGRRQIQDFREISCDQEVLTEFQASPKTYAKLIFSLIHQSDHSLNLQVSLTEQNSNLKKRISNMKYHSKYRSSYKKSIFFIAVLSVAMVLPIACTEMSAEDTNESTAEVLPAPPEFKLKDLDNENTLITLDGKDITYEELEKVISPDGIASIDVRKLDNGSSSISIISKKNESQLKPTAVTPLTGDGETVFKVVETMPELVGGMDGLKSKIRYPKLAAKQGIEGRVIVTFIVDKDGNVRDAQVARGIGAGCDEEALRVIQQAKFKPGIQRGENVDVRMMIPLVFKLQ